MDALMSLVVLLLALGILAGHVLVSASMWQPGELRANLLKMAGLALISYVIWYLVAALVGIPVGLYTPGIARPAEDMYYSTFGVLIYPCDGLPALAGFLGGFICDLPGFVVGVPVFFILGLLGGWLSELRSRPRPAPTNAPPTSSPPSA